MSGCSYVVSVLRWVLGWDVVDGGVMKFGGGGNVLLYNIL